MTDFLDELERELMHAARRRSASRHRLIGLLRRRGAAVLADLRAVGSGAMMVGSAGAVVVVVAVVMVSGRHVASLPGRASVGRVALPSSARERCASGAQGRAPAVSDTAPGRDVRRLLGTDAPTAAGVQRVAIRELDASASHATVVYARYIRVVRVPGGARVILIPARTCRGAGRSSVVEPTLLAEVRSRSGVATIRLGTPAQIRTGDAFRSAAVFVESGHGRRVVSMVPDDVLSVICRRVGSGTGARRFAVVHHLVVMPRPAAGIDCDLVRA